MKSYVFLPLVLALLTAPMTTARAEDPVPPVHALAMHGKPKYGPDFEHFDYANPSALKGGEARLHAIGTFDTLNAFTLKGIPAAGLGNMYDTLLVGSDDEAFTEYGLLAQSIQVPKDRSWAVFTLRPEAKWHDGKPITVEDVIFSLETLKKKGHPFYRAYYANVARAEKAGARRVKFIFSGGENRELPLIIGQLPVLPKHYWQGRDFQKTTLEPPLGSGPYRIKAFSPGRSITYERVPNYWGKDLPVNRGRYNFQIIRYDYYRDSTVALQAFKAGEYDFRLENSSKDWATAYDIPAVKEGLIVKEAIPHERPTGMQGFVYNIRKSIFRDRRVREALAYAFDFEWANRNLFYGQYTRTKSYFSNSELASRGLPGPEELKILEPFHDKLPPEVFTREYEPPSTAGGKSIRSNLRKALKLLTEAGWVFKGRKLVNRETETPFTFEILLNSPTWERIALPFAKNLERLGIDVRVRTVDTSQYQKRVEEFDFDMIVDVFPQSLSPGNEQRDFWSSASADQPGSRNTIGIKDPVLDALIDLVISAPDRESLIYRTRALDRVLLWGHYVIPHWHIRYFRVAYWNKFSRPKITPKYALGFDTWWIDPEKEAILLEKKASLKKR
ncbi:MAG: ABC transporter substrate-binding protein [Deltaproteobacteria bacterium]|nr:ABC transporter substrate-binding protein [Deltaproteobacteria bacterium]